jgi:excinuclease UvrABC helicase subunit UvrB
MLATPDEAARCGYNDGQLTTRRKSWQKKYKVKDSAKPRHVLRQIRDGTPAERADADRRRNSSNRSYGTGSTAQGAAAAHAVNQ